MDGNTGKSVSAEYVLKAAKVLATCQKDRIPMVVSVLEQGGIIIDETIYSFLSCCAISREDKLKTERQKNDRKNWEETDDELSLYLRKAFDDGIDFRKLYERAGLNKSTIYRMMWGRRGTDFSRTAVKNALDSLYEERERENE